MILWSRLTKDIDPKDVADVAEFREAKDSDTNHHLNGIVVSKKSNKSYNILVKMDTKSFQSDSKIKVFCGCDDFAYRRAFVLNKFDALLIPQNFILTPPKKTNPTEILSCCKHIKVFLELKNQMRLKTISNQKGSI